MAHPNDSVQMEQLWTNARLATLADGELGLIDNGAVAAVGGRIVYAGPAEGAPKTAEKVQDIGGRLITPGLIDCHTHLVHGGNRANEWAMRLAGASYEDIARAGGGIVSTMRATREASETELLDAALPRLDALIAEGITTIEIKSGYGLSTEDELKMLRAARALGDRRAIRIEPTFLGAHALPPEYRNDSDAYIDLVVNEMIPAAAPLATAVDAFCEGIGFSPAQCTRVIEAAKAHGLAVKLHAEQLSVLHGSALAARHGALSADHLEHATDDDVRAMAEA
ncbi:MAG: imidazolonepropionase, partial [Sphingopyxis sp.]|nr:imidazolonepropionase [Sphingopyxis sp.]